MRQGEPLSLKRIRPSMRTAVLHTDTHPGPRHRHPGGVVRVALTRDLRPVLHPGPLNVERVVRSNMQAMLVPSSGRSKVQGRCYTWRQHHTYRTGRKYLLAFIAQLFELCLSLLLVPTVTHVVFIYSLNVWWSSINGIAVGLTTIGPFNAGC